MTRGRPSFRAVMALAATALTVALAGCNTETGGGLSGVLPTRALKPLSQDMVSDMERKGMPTSSPILVRIFKEEAELEVWKQDGNGRYALLKTYPICRWSGELGPKVKEGDRQAPEGFYNITPGLMNPHSNYYLAFNLGFPNAYDRANDRTGNFLMVHGDCSSRGCYAMTDEQIEEIFALGRDSFSGGQKSFQVQAYPFRMTPMNMAKHRNSPHMAFWRMLKQGNDHFELTRQEPKVDVCEKRYVFNAESPNGGPLSFSSRNRCPAYQVTPEVAAAVKEKTDADEAKFAELAARGTPTVAVRTGTDGGMHPTFLARLKPKNLLDGMFSDTKVAGAQPGTMPTHVNPPRGSDGEIVTATARTSTPPAEPTAAAYATPVTQAQIRAASAATARTEPNRNEPIRSQPARTEPVRSQTAAVHTPAARPAQAAPKAAEPKQVADAQPPAPVAAPTALMSGSVAAPLPAASFDSRWGGGGSTFR